MGILSLNVSARENQPPSSSGWVSIAVGYNTDYPFTIENFTTETSPAYVDPEGDNLEYIKITTITTVGEVKLNGTAITADDTISNADLVAGNLTYTPANDADGYTEIGYFTVSDEGSSTFTTTPQRFIMNVDNDVNSSPATVGDGETDMIVGETFTFTRESLTTQLNPPYSDPEGDIAENLWVITAPTTGELRLDGALVIDNEIISFTDIDSGLLTYYASEYPDGGIEGFAFQISDVGSGEYTG